MKDKLMKKVTLKVLADMLDQLQMMFMGASQSPRLFEFLIFDMLPRTDAVKWERWENEKWVDHEWRIDVSKHLGKNAEKVADMESNVLYYPVDEQFPGVGFYF